MDERLKKQVDFILEIDKEKNIFRRTHLSGHGRRENDAEHAWHMAVMAYLLREYANEEIDVLKTMMMCLIHDVVEIDAGDTYAYDDVNLATQKERKDQEQELKELFDEFEAGESPEARFAHALDNFQPLLLNNSNDGADWREHDINEVHVYRRHAATKAGSERLYEETDKMLQDNIKKGNIIRGSR